MRLHQKKNTRTQSQSLQRLLSLEQLSVCNLTSCTSYTVYVSTSRSVLYVYPFLSMSHTVCITLFNVAVNAAIQLNRIEYSKNFVCECRRFDICWTNWRQTTWKFYRNYTFMSILECKYSILYIERKKNQQTMYS